MTAVISSDPAIEAAVLGALDPDGTMTLADITGDIASGFDTIQNDYGDILNDPTQESLPIPLYKCLCQIFLSH